MNKKGFILLAGVIFIIILCFVGGRDEPKDSDMIVDGTNLISEKIKMVHIFADGMHTFTGEINLPTPCHTLTHEVIVAESFPEQAVIVFETKSDVDSCVQMIMSEPFTVSFKASEEATVKITLNGENIPFEIIEAELPEDVISGADDKADIEDSDGDNANGTVDTIGEADESEDTPAETE